MKTEFRNNGAVRALLDEYERALTELKNVILPITDKELVTIVDDITNDPDCRSIQTILTHIIKSGYCYVIEIRKSLGEQIDFLEQITLESIEQYKTELNKLFRYNKILFDDYPNMNISETNSQNKILVQWGEQYSVEQLFEHAIVHVLRHRRQIQKFILKLDEIKKE